MSGNLQVLLKPPVDFLEGEALYGWALLNPSPPSVLRSGPSSPPQGGRLTAAFVSAFEKIGEAKQ